MHLYKLVLFVMTDMKRVQNQYDNVNIITLLLQRFKTKKLCFKRDWKYKKVLKFNSA